MSEEEVANQIQNLASLLGITAHSNPKVTAMAIDKYLKRISLGEQNAKHQEEIKTFPLQTFDLGVHATGNDKVGKPHFLLEKTFRNSLWRDYFEYTIGSFNKCRNCKFLQIF